MEEFKVPGGKKTDMRGLHLGDGVGMSRSILWRKVSRKLVLSKACLSYCLCSHVSFTDELLNLYC